LCVLSRGPASATSRATSSITVADTPDSRSAKSKLYSAYRPASAVSKLSKVAGSAGRSASMYSSQFQ
jgi:hypothetical protein